VVIITRPKAAAQALGQALGKLGARVVYTPLIQIVPPLSWRTADAAIRHLNDFDAIAFASQNAVDSFFTRAQRILGKNPVAPGLVAAVGPATANALVQHGWRATVIAEQRRAEGLARALKLPRHARILIPRALKGRPALISLLKESGLKPVPIVVYRTVTDKRGTRVLRVSIDSADAICFASGSAVQAAVSALGRAQFKRALKSCHPVALGPVTAQALTTAGVSSTIAQNTDPSLFAAAVVKALQEKNE
jgi:uroporphyrinogen-III synthase